MDETTETITEISTETKTETTSVDTPKSKNGGYTFRGGLILGLCIGLTVAIGVGVFAIVRWNYYAKIMGDVTDWMTIGKIATIEDLIETSFYDYNERNLTVEDMREGLYDGLISSLDDKYAAYYTEEEMIAETEDNQGVYYGIGAYVSLGENNYPFLSGIMDDTPADDAGLRAGDIVVEVDGISVYGLSLDEVVGYIKGPEGTTVHLTIYRDGEDDYIGFDVVRGAIKSQTVTHEMLDDGIGYIRIIRFDYVTIEQFESAYQDLRDQNMRALVLDLRNNPGGLVNSVVGVAQQILPEGTIFYEEDADGSKHVYSCDGTHEIDIPMVVLVNGYSASAAEILSGSIRDYGVGTLVGTTTYGKGIVQNTIMLSDMSAVEFTVGAYYLPNGDNIQGTGIEPDVVIELDEEAYYEDGTDNQLDKGIELIKKELQNK